MQLHIMTCASALGGAGKRPLDATATFLHQRQEHPQRYRSHRQRYADFGSASRREGPVQSRAHLSDLTAVARQPGGRWQSLQLYLGSFKETPVIIRMASCHLFELAAFGELLQGVGACGLV